MSSSAASSGAAATAAPKTPEPRAGGDAAEASTPSKTDNVLAALGPALQGALKDDGTEVEIQRLRQERQKHIAAKKAAATALRNAERKRKRLHDRAQNLSTDDLLKILGQRAQWRQKRTRASASTAGAASAEPPAAAPSVAASAEPGAAEPSVAPPADGEDAEKEEDE